MGDDIFSGEEALKAVAKEKGPWNWCFIGGDPDELPLAGGGSGSLDEMRECLAAQTDSSALYGLMRLKFGTGRLSRVKYVFVAATTLDDQPAKDEAAEGTVKSRVGRKSIAGVRPQMERAFSKFAHFTCSLEVTSIKDFTFDAIVDRVKRVSTVDGDAINVENLKAAMAEEVAASPAAAAIADEGTLNELIEATKVGIELPDIDGNDAAQEEPEEDEATAEVAEPPPPPPMFSPTSQPSKSQSYKHSDSHADVEPEKVDDVVPVTNNRTSQPYAMSSSPGDGDWIEDNRGAAEPAEGKTSAEADKADAEAAKAQQAAEDAAAAAAAANLKAKAEEKASAAAKSSPPSAGSPQPASPADDPKTASPSGPSPETAESYNLGDLVLVFSDSKGEWYEDGEVMSVLSETTEIGGIKFPPGSLRVRYQDKKRIKCIAPGDFARSLRKSLRPKPPPYLTGHLQKETHDFLARWHDRFFLLKQGCLQWWVAEMEARRGVPPHKTLGLLGLKLALKGKIIQVRTAHSKGTVESFDAGSPEVARKWARALEEHAAYAMEMKNFLEAQREAQRQS